MNFKNPVTFVVRINPMRDLVILVDMLRYEGSVVLGWESGDRGSILVTLRTERHLFQPDRWSSFLITPREV